MSEERCRGCGYTKYGHVVAIERMVASGHEWEPRGESDVSNSALPTLTTNETREDT